MKTFGYKIMQIFSVLLDIEVNTKSDKLTQLLSRGLREQITAFMKAAAERAA